MYQEAPAVARGGDTGYGTVRSSGVVANKRVQAVEAVSASQRLDGIIGYLESHANRADRIRRGIIGIEPSGKTPDVPQPVAFSLNDKLQVIDRLLDQLRVDLEVIESTLGFG